MARNATGLALDLLDATARARLRVRGGDDLPPGPILFVCNHFTRSETFMIPWILKRAAGRDVSSLAWHGLFRGRFGRFLESVGARSTREPGIKRRIVEELAAGESDWLIYPEGEMVKNKEVWNDGALSVHGDGPTLPHHTGAALFALEAARRRTERGLEPALHVVPMNVTYHPMRPPPGIHRAARRFLSRFPQRYEEELLVEGSFFFSRTDIDVVFGKPVDVREWLREEDRDEPPRALLRRVTTRLMQDVYGLVVRNVDHLVATALRTLGGRSLHEDDLARALLLAARDAQSSSDGFWHEGVGPALLDAASGVRSRAIDDVLALAERECACARAAGILKGVPRAGHVGYADARLRHAVHVLAGEIAPDRPLVRAVERWVARDAASLRAHAAEAVERIDLELHAREGGREDLAPRWVSPPEPRGVLVLSHGYLASTAETAQLAEHLAARGWACYLVRLQGHGSTPAALSRVHRADWWRSYQRGLAAARARHPDLPLVVAGFSAGSLFALRAAAELADPPQGLVVVNAPVLLANRASLLAPALDVWNRLARGAGLRGLVLDAVPNRSEYPDDNYARNPVRALHQLELAISETRRLLGRVRSPALVVQSARDPVVRPESAALLVDGISSASRSMLWWPSARHGIIRGRSCHRLHERISAWLDPLLAAPR